MVFHIFTSRCLLCILRPTSSLSVSLSLPRPRHPRALHSFPTRRSSDLFGHIRLGDAQLSTRKGNVVFLEDLLDEAVKRAKAIIEDRKSTRLNSSHVKISYAVFCLKKKTTPRADAVQAPGGGPAYTQRLP